MKVLLCYSKDNKELADVVKEYLKSVNDSLDIRISCDGKEDRVGKKGADTLHENLNDADIYIPILTKEFYASRFCVMAFGAAVFYLYNKYKYEAGDLIYPLCVYPLNPEKALKYTLIAHLPAYDIMNENVIEELSRRLGGSENGIKSGTKEFIYDIKKIAYGKTNLLQLATEIKGFAWGGNAEGTIGKDNERFCNVDSNEKRINVGFNLSPRGFEDEKKKKPDFGVFLIFRDTVNMDTFLSLSKEARLVFELNSFTSSFKQFTVEFKTDGQYGKVKVGEETLAVKEDCATYEVPLSVIGGENDRKAISEVNIIVLSENTVEDEGSFYLKNITIKTD